MQKGTCACWLMQAIAWLDRAAWVFHTSQCVGERYRWWPAGSMVELWPPNTTMHHESNTSIVENGCAQQHLGFSWERISWAICCPPVPVAGNV